MEKITRRDLFRRTLYGLSTGLAIGGAGNILDAFRINNEGFTKATGKSSFEYQRIYANTRREVEISMKAALISAGVGFIAHMIAGSLERSSHQLPSRG